MKELQGVILTSSRHDAVNVLDEPINLEIEKTNTSNSKHCRITASPYTILLTTWKKVQLLMLSLVWGTLDVPLQRHVICSAGLDWMTGGLLGGRTPANP